MKYRQFNDFRFILEPDTEKFNNVVCTLVHGEDSIITFSINSSRLKYCTSVVTRFKKRNSHFRLIFNSGVYLEVYNDDIYLTTMILNNLPNKPYKINPNYEDYFIIQDQVV